MNRHQQRAAAAQAGIAWRKWVHDRLLREAPKMSQAEAREALARWAAQPGRTQAEVDALNARAGASLMGTDDAG